jgi:hypothetical protein
MREEKQLKVTSKPGPSVYSGPAGQVPEAQPAPNLTAAVSPGPCLYTLPEHDLSETTSEQGTRNRSRGRFFRSL